MSASPMSSSIGLNPGYFGGHMLGAHHNPFETGGDPNSPNFTVQNLNLAQGLTLQRLEDRRTLNNHFDRMLRDLDNRGTAQAMDRFNQEAFDFVTGPTARQAFNINREDPRCATCTAGTTGAKARCWRAGWSKPARRLSPSISAAGTITGTCKPAMNAICRMVDSLRLRPVRRSAAARPARSDAGRPVRRIQPHAAHERRRQRRRAEPMGTPGRDHWGNSMFCLMGGGGVKGGMVVGSTEPPRRTPARLAR